MAILGVSYKPGIGDVRESPALKIMDLLAALGAELRYHDPYVPELRAGLDLHSLGLEEAIEDADVVVIVTAHPELDVAAVVDGPAPVVDLRGVTRELTASNVMRL